MTSCCAETCLRLYLTSKNPSGSFPAAKIPHSSIQKKGLSPPQSNFSSLTLSDKEFVLIYQLVALVVVSQLVVCQSVSQLVVVVFVSVIVISLSRVLVSSSSVRVNIRDSSSSRATSPTIINIKDSSSSVRLYIYIKPHWLLSIIRSLCQVFQSVE